MRVSVLTSSRADFGIYLPLLNSLNKDPYFDLNIIAFGTHLSHEHGFTLNNIIEHGFNVQHKVKNIIGDTPKEIAEAMALTIKEFSEIWNVEKGKTDLIICVGDRYEMYAAVSASIPFNLSIAHIHGGETTLGSIDNIFRHSLTLMATYHFTSTESHSEKVIKLTNNMSNVFNIGSLSLDNIDTIQLLSIDEFKFKFNIDLTKPTILVTFHPETVLYENNEGYTKEICSTFEEMQNFQIVITMPNADTMGNIIRENFIHLSSKYNHIFSVENFGIQGYFSAMKHCKFLLGNTSSGILEAASFNKYVINLGNRQKGRTAGKNVLNVPIDKILILEMVKKVTNWGEFFGENIYKGTQPANQRIIEVLKKI